MKIYLLVNLEQFVNKLTIATTKDTISNRFEQILNRFQNLPVVINNLEAKASLKIRKMLYLSQKWIIWEHH